MSKKLTTEQFIEKAKAVHGDRYDYGEVVYKDSRSDVAIICKTHGIFMQKGNAHLQGSGCKKCGAEKRMDSTRTDESLFLSRVKKVHGDEYDYSKFRYVGLNHKSIIICKEHGEFKQLPASHLSGNGCPKCKGKKISKRALLSKDDFVAIANSVHNGKYIYDKVDYKGNRFKAIITCPIHGDFAQLPSNHLSGRGCPKCGKKDSVNKKTRSKDSLLKQIRATHGDTYIYPDDNDWGAKKKIRIICKKHGEFIQRADSHAGGKNCPKCGIDIMAEKSPSWSYSSWELAARKSKRFDGFKLYLVLLGNPLTGEYFLKVGKTYLSIKDRFYHIKYDHKVISTFESDAITICRTESMIKKGFRQSKSLPSMPFGGMHECFSITALDALMTEFEKLNGQSNEL